MVHVTTVVGGAFVRTLPFMLRHYYALGVRSFFVNVQLADPDDPALARVARITADFGIEIASVTIGPWNQVQKHIYAHARRAHPDDWFILADQDELQQYPVPLFELIDRCEAEGYDHITGCLIDRLADGGCLAALRDERPIDEQFPIKAFVTWPLSGCDPRKVVAARSSVAVIRGQHYALNGRALPMDRAFVPVHHFKWVSDLARDLTHRAALLKAEHESHWETSARIVAHLAAHDGRIDIDDPRFLASRGPGHEYDRWDDVVRIIKDFNIRYPPQAQAY
jgi:hypothetical protein